MKKTNYLERLWENYINLCSSAIPDNLLSYEEMNLWVENTMHEEFLLLKSLFVISRFQTIPPELNFKMLEVFYNQGFQGSFHFHNNYKNLKMQDYYQNQLKLAQNITDICILILLANMSMDSLDNSLLTEINSSKAPFSLFQKTGEKLFEFFLSAKSLQEISLIFMAFRNEVLFFNQLHKSSKKGEMIPKFLYEYDLNALLKYENINYLGYIRDMMSHELFKNNEDFIVLQYRLIIKNWVNLCVLHANDWEIYQNYDFYVDIFCHCFSDPILAHYFWEEDFKKARGLPNFVEKLISFFPLKSSKLLKFLGSLICQHNSCSVNFIIKCLGNMTVLTTEAREIDSETIFFSTSEAHDEAFTSLEDVQFNEFFIPKGTHYKVLFKTIDGEDIPLVFQWDFEYNYWNNIFCLWTQTINKLTEKPLETIDQSLISGIKLICKALVAEPKFLFMLEQYLIQNKMKSSVYPTSVTLILLLVDSLFYFQRLKNPAFTLFSHIISALKSLINYEERNFKTMVCFMIQLHPYTIVNVEKNRLYTINEHPFFEIISLIKIHDNSMEYNTKKYNLLLEILSFSYDLFKNEEFPIHLFPNDQYTKYSYYNTANYEYKIQDLVLRIQSLHETNEEWSSSRLDEINSIAENLKNFQIKSAFLDDLLKTIYQFVLPNYDKFLFLPNELIKKFEIGNYIFKITNLLLNKFTLNLERINIYYTQNIENPLLKMIVKHLNATNINDFILQTLCVHVNIQDSELSYESEAPTCLENKLWTTYIQNPQNDLNYPLRMALRNMISSCLSTIETIVYLLEMYNENKILNNENKTLAQMEVNNLEIVDNFYRIFSSKEEMICYQQSYLTHSGTKQISLNLVLAIASMINFEEYKDLKSINESLNNTNIFPFNLDEMDMENNQNFFYSADFTLGQNILSKGKTKSNLYQDSICYMSLRILSKLLVFWEGLQTSKKPLLSELLVSLSLQSEIGTSFIYLFYKEMIRILYCCGMQHDEAIAVLELMLVSLHSQKSFIDPFLKDASLLLNIPNNIKLNKKFHDFCESILKSKNPEKITKEYLFFYIF